MFGFDFYLRSLMTTGMEMTLSSALLSGDSLSEEFEFLTYP